MSSTFSQIYLQFVFAVKGRHSLLPKENKEELHKYMTGLVQNRKAKMLAVHCMPDHTHLFGGFKPVIFIPDFIREIKLKAMNLLIARIGSKVGFAGRKDTACFHIL